MEYSQKIPAQVALPPSGVVLRTKAVTALARTVTGAIVGGMPFIPLGNA